MNIFLVYRHTNKISGAVFYVGIASRRDRAYYFRNRSKSWKSYVAKYGDPQVEIIHERLTRVEAATIEQELILKYGRKNYEPGGTLVNQSLGGEIQYGWRQSVDAKNNISKAVTGRKHKVESIEKMKGKKSDLVRLKMSLSKIGHVVTNETRQKLSLNASSKRPEVAKKISAALTGRRGSLNACSKRVLQMDQEGNVIAEHESIMLAADNVGGDFRLISAVCRGKRNKHKNFIWKYV